jgi:rRNA processing protein Gar1
MAIFCNLLKNDSSIFGKVIDVYFVIKFQNKGSEHDHGLLWIKNDLIYGVDKMKPLDNLSTNM